MLRTVPASFVRRVSSVGVARRTLATGCWSAPATASTGSSATPSQTHARRTRTVVHRRGFATSPAGLTLVLADHDGSKLLEATQHVISAAKAIGGQVAVLVLGANADAVAQEAAKIEGVTKVIYVEDKYFEHGLAEGQSTTIADIVKETKSATNRHTRQTAAGQRPKRSTTPPPLAHPLVACVSLSRLSACVVPLTFSLAPARAARTFCRAWAPTSTSSRSRMWSATHSRGTRLSHQSYPCSPRVGRFASFCQLEVKSADTFVRPIYAGNAIATVQSSDAIKIITVRPTSFERAPIGAKAVSRRTQWTVGSGCHRRLRASGTDVELLLSVFCRLRSTRRRLPRLRPLPVSAAGCRRSSRSPLVPPSGPLVWWSRVVAA